MRAWKPLKKNDIIDVVAPASRCPREELTAAIRFLKAQGFRPRIAKNIFGKNPLHANEDKIRFAQLKKALYAKDSTAVWCVRGGYGANRLMPALAKLKSPKLAKAVIGISDITSLHVVLNGKWNWSTLHASMLGSIGGGRTPQHIQAELLEILKGEQQYKAFAKLKSMNASAKKKKSIRGVVVGGNLVTLQSTLGTPYQMSLKGKILFLEEIAERGYRIDRILEHFEQSGFLKGCKAIVLGDFLGGDESDGKNFVWWALERFAKNNKIPVLKGLPSGHGKILEPLPFNTKASLVTGTNASLICETGVSK